MQFNSRLQMVHTDSTSSAAKSPCVKRLLHACAYVTNFKNSSGDCKLRAENLKKKLKAGSCNSEEVINDLVVIIGQLTSVNDSTSENSPLPKETTVSDKDVKDVEKAVNEVFEGNPESPVRLGLLNKLNANRNCAFSVMRQLVNFAIIEARNRAERERQLMTNIEGAVSSLITKSKSAKEAESSHIADTVSFIRDMTNSSASLKDEIGSDSALNNPKVIGLISSIESQLNAQAISQKTYQDKAESLLIAQQAQVDNLLAETENLKKQLLETKKLAETDSLTRLKNRRSFEIKKAENKSLNKPFSFAIIDIDHFKKINDNFGHAAGHMVIKSFSDILHSISSSTVHPYRIGGEEFGVIIDGEYNAHHLSMMRYIRVSAAKDTCNTPYGDISYTVSIGQSSSKEGDKFVEMADRRLYKSKESGRNMITYMKKAIQK